MKLKRTSISTKRLKVDVAAYVLLFPQLLVYKRNFYSQVPGSTARAVEPFFRKLKS